MVVVAEEGSHVLKLDLHRRTPVVATPPATNLRAAFTTVEMATSISRATCPCDGRPAAASLAMARKRFAGAGSRDFQPRRIGIGPRVQIS